MRTDYVVKSYIPFLDRESKFAKVLNELKTIGVLTPESFIAGGCLRRHLSGEDPLAADIDMFFTEVPAMIDVQNKLEAAGFFINKKYMMVTELMGEIAGLDVTIQLISTKMGSMDEVLDQFFDSVSQFAYDGEEFIEHKSAMPSLVEGIYTINRHSTAHDDVRRIEKLAKQGFKLSYESYLKIITAKNLYDSERTNWLGYVEEIS